MERKKNRIQMLNLIKNTRNFSYSKDKDKNTLVLNTISSDLQKIKSISNKQKAFHLSSIKNNSQQNIFKASNNSIITQGGIFNNIPIPDWIPYKAKLKETYSNSNIQKSSTSNSPKKEILTTCPNSGHNMHMIPKTSFERSSLTRMKKENDKLKVYLKEKEEEINQKNQKISSLEKTCDASKKNINYIKSKYIQLQDAYNKICEENKNMKMNQIQTQQEIKYLKEKEMRLMQVIYLLKERGINIDEVLNEVSNMNSNILSDEGTMLSQESINTVYFPDKIKMNDIMNNQGKKIPKMNFDLIPSYHSESSSGQNFTNINISSKIKLNQVKMKFNKINFTNEQSSN